MPILYKPLPVTSDELKRLVHYNPETGVMTSRVHRGPLPIGQVIGWGNKGYRHTSIYEVGCLVHRLVWLYMTGDDPGDMEVDHINRDGSDNRWENLRLATHRENMRNGRRRSSSTTGHVGVHYYKERGNWTAHITTNYKTKCLGYFATIEDAIAARLAAEAEYHGAFAQSLSPNPRRDQ